jgi:hypothetical protein
MAQDGKTTQEKDTELVLKFYLNERPIFDYPLKKGAKINQITV